MSIDSHIISTHSDGCVWSSKVHPLLSASKSNAADASVSSYSSVGSGSGSTTIAPGSSGQSSSSSGLLSADASTSAADGSASALPHPATPSPNTIATATAVPTLRMPLMPGIVPLNRR